MIQIYTLVSSLSVEHQFSWILLNCLADSQNVEGSSDWNLLGSLYKFMSFKIPDFLLTPWKLMPNDFNEIIVNVISRNKSYFKYDVENPLKGVLKNYCACIRVKSNIYVIFYLS